MTVNGFHKFILKDIDNYLETISVIPRNENKHSREDKIIKDKYQTNNGELLPSSADCMLRFGCSLFTTFHILLPKRFPAITKDKTCYMLANSFPNFICFTYVFMLLQF